MLLYLNVYTMHFYYIMYIKVAHWSYISNIGPSIEIGFKPCSAVWNVGQVYPCCVVPCHTSVWTNIWLKSGDMYSRIFIAHVILYATAVLLTGRPKRQLHLNVHALKPTCFIKIFPW